MSNCTNRLDAGAVLELRRSLDHASDKDLVQ